MSNSFYTFLYIGGAILAIALYLLHLMRVERRSRNVFEESKKAGLTEPPSLHPVIDEVRCIGCASCVHACPEEALGLIKNKAVLINAADCIGHGACRDACPVGGITLVFGTAKRGIDIPVVKPNFETNVPGIFIAGELGGMGLIRKTAEQGRKAMDAIRAHKGGKGDYDVMIIGAGPAGFSAALSAIEHKLRYKVIEQENSLGGAVYHYPRNKIAMTAPVKLALLGTVRMNEIKKEKLLEFWHDGMRKTGMEIAFGERMEGVERDGASFIVRTTRGQYRTRTVLLALGRRGTPRRLDVAGEDQAKVVYRLVDPEQYRDMAVLVVGGGDSALEAAIALAEQPGTTVTLSYRSEAFGRVKEKNRSALKAQQDAGRVNVLLNSNVKTIGERNVVLNCAGKDIELANDAVIICAGGILPTPLLQQIGIEFETKFGTA